MQTNNQKVTLKYYINDYRKLPHILHNNVLEAL